MGNNNSKQRNHALGFIITIGIVVAAFSIFSIISISKLGETHKKIISTQEEHIAKLDSA